MDESGLGPLLSRQYHDDDVQHPLEAIGFTDPRAAARRLERIATTPAARAAFAKCLPHLSNALTSAASPDRALINLERFAGSVPDPAALFNHLASHPRTMGVLITLFAGSQFLTEILLRNPDYFSRLTEHNGLAHLKPPAQLDAEARAVAAVRPAGDGYDGNDAETLEPLRQFQRWELLRIGTSDLLGLLDLPSVTVQLSRLADSIVRVCLASITSQAGSDPAGFVVLAMGKLGGSELNYSSDIDLLFLADTDAASYQRLGERLIATLTKATGEGFLYRVDMRLRPWGQVGPLISTVDGYLAYLQKHARLWEKQALLKARVIAGNARVGSAFLRAATPLLFMTSREALRADVHAMKQRTEARLLELGRSWGEIKLGEGSIRDVEFVAQYLQLAYGGEYPELRGGNTLEALSRLAEHDLLTADDYRVLAEGYIFLRTVEHYLQILEYRQTHQLPADPADLRYLAHRLGFQGVDAGARFVTRYGQHSAAVRAVYQRHLAPPHEKSSEVLAAGRLPKYMARSPKSKGGSAMQSPTSLPPDDVGLIQHVARMGPSYTATFSEREIQRHADLAARLDNNNPVEVRADALSEGLWRVTVVAYDYLGELSLICGLLFAHGFSIIDGQVYTYQPQIAPPIAPQPVLGRPRPSAEARHPELAEGPSARRKIVDVFTVRPVAAPPAGTSAGPDVWLRYAGDLASLLRLLQAREQRQAQGELAKRVATALREAPGAIPTLHPVDITIDNDTSDQYTILYIDAPDTPGFLYEFTNALALDGVYIAQVSVASLGNRVQDTLYVTDAQGRKITDLNRQRELRAATVLVKHFTHLLPHSPNPESALLHFHEYLGELFRRPSWPDELASLERPEVLNALARLLGVSDFLWDDFLRMQYANLFPIVRDVDALGVAKSKAQLAAELAAALGAEPDGAARRDRLNAFKDREMFRIDMRHIQGHIAELDQFSAELTDLAEAVVEAAWHICVQELQLQYNQPRNDQGIANPLTIFALGKCGGRELGFASDIELMFVFAGSGQTTGPRVITTAEYYEKLVIEIVHAIRARREGIFEIDLQLRPYGSGGSLAVSLDSFRRYFAPLGPAWSYERQALVKLRPIVGDPDLARMVVGLRDEYVYSGEPFDIAAMRAMRERQIRHLVTAGTINAKYSLGGLVDVEYIVQGLQITHGRRHPELRVTNTRAALAALAQVEVISVENYARLSQAHTFLERLINALRMVRGSNRDLTVPPEDSEEFAFLARRLGYGSDPVQLRVELAHHTGWVRQLDARLLG